MIGEMLLDLAERRQSQEVVSEDRGQSQVYHQPPITDARGKLMG